MRETLLALFAPSVPALRFACKTLIGAGLALWVALRLNLEQPEWALMTALIVAQPLAGMVVQKALARLAGTVAGAAMAILLVALAAQAPWLFLIALSAWLALCTGSSTLLRSAWSYAFVLAGYTTVLVAMPALSEPLAIFDHAVARCTEIMLGILCASASSVLLWPQQVQRQLLGQAEAVWKVALQQAQDEVQADPEAQRKRLAALGQIVALDTQREHAWFEGFEGRRRARAVAVLSHALVGLLHLARALRRQLAELDAPGRQALAPWEAALLAGLADGGERPVGLRESLVEQARDPEQPSVRAHALGRMILLLDALDTARQAHRALLNGTRLAEPEGGFSSHRDPSSAALFGLRSGLTFLLLSSFWLATGWIAVEGALILSSVICGLFAARENAVQIGFGFLRGTALAVPTAFVVGYLLLPQLNGFPMLCLAVGVPLFLGALGMARPSIAGTATAFVLHFTVLTLPHAENRYDLEFFINSALAMLVGVSCALLAYRLVLIDPVARFRRLRRGTLRDLAYLTRRRRLGGGEAWFNGRMLDRLVLLSRQAPLPGTGDPGQWESGLVGLELGDELLNLRRFLAEAGHPDPAGEDAALRALEQLLLDGPSPRRMAALEPIGAALELVFEASGCASAQRQGRAALRQLDRSWRQWCELQGKIDALA